MNREWYHRQSVPRATAELEKPLNHRDLSPARPPEGVAVSTVRGGASNPREPSRGPTRIPFICGLVASLAGLGGLLAAPSTGAIRSFEISQTAVLEGSPTALRSYARVLDERNEPLFHLEGTTISATLGDRDLELVGVQAFHQSGEGVAYVFLVDISRSLSEREFALIQEALENWMTSLRPQDRVAILAFGDQSRLVVDFTNEVDRLRESIEVLGPTDASTVLFESLHDAFELARRRDPDLPGRRVLIVLTDGRDEGSGWSLEDILAVLHDDPAPIYAIGLSRIRDPAERNRSLQLLRRLATNSGGAFFETSTASLTKSYSAIREAIHNVWVLDFSCPDCTRDGRSYRFQANLFDGERVFSDGHTIRLLPSAVSIDAKRAKTAELEPEAESEEPREPPAEESLPEPAAHPGSNWRWGWLALPLVAAIAAGWLVWNRRARSPISPDTDLDSLPPVGPVESPTYTAASGVVTTRPPRPIRLRVVRLIVVRGKKPGSQYNVTLLEKAVAGTRSTCDCVLFGEPGISPEQFELSQGDGNVFVRNLSKNNPTLVDGLSLEGRQRIQSESLLGTRDFIVRVIFGEGRATARS